MGDGEQVKERLDVFFIAKNKLTKRVTFRMCTRTDIKDILDKAEAVVEMFKLYNDFAFVISDDMEVEE